jgi:hypothetical protein
MNSTLTFSTITVPTPEPYDEQHADRQRENCYYVVNQLLAQLHANNATVDLEPVLQALLDVDLTDLIQAVQDLAFTGTSIELPGFHVKRIGSAITIEYTP